MCLKNCIKGAEKLYNYYNNNGLCTSNRLYIFRKSVFIRSVIFFKHLQPNVLLNILKEYCCSFTGHRQESLSRHI